MSLFVFADDKIQSLCNKIASLIINLSLQNK
jgi:hypothetical protein